MKLLILIFCSLAIVACNQGDIGEIAEQNALCEPKDLKLSTYKDAKAVSVQIPSNPIKDDSEPAIDGHYVLTSSTIHVHDKNFLLPKQYQTRGEEFLQYSIHFAKALQSPAEIKENTFKLKANIKCISGLLPEYAGLLEYTSNLPTNIEVLNNGATFSPEKISEINFSYAPDRSTPIVVNELDDKSGIDGIDSINPKDSDDDFITAVYKKQPKNESYQLHHRVNQGNTVLTIISNYSRCVNPSEDIKNKDKTQAAQDKLKETYDLCLERNIILEGK